MGQDRSFVLLDGKPLTQHVIERIQVLGVPIIIITNQPHTYTAELLDFIVPRVLELAYTDAEFDLVDCCIMPLSERLNITQVATFDRRDFSTHRPGQCNYLELLP